MNSSPKNPNKVNHNQMNNFVSSSEQDSNSLNRLDGLLELLIDLKILDPIEELEKTSEKEAQKGIEGDRPQTSADFLLSPSTNEPVGLERLEKTDDLTAKIEPPNISLQSKFEENGGKSADLLQSISTNEPVGAEEQLEKTDDLTAKIEPPNSSPQPESIVQSSNSANNLDDLEPLWECLRFLTPDSKEIKEQITPIEPEEKEQEIIQEHIYKELNKELIQSPPPESEEQITPIEPEEKTWITPQILQPESAEDTTKQLIKLEQVDDLDSLVNPLEQLQNLLLGPELSNVPNLVAYFEQKLGNIEHQIYEPTELRNLILPLITEILSIKVAESNQELAQAIAPLIDRMIEAKTQQDKSSIIAAIAPLLPGAISQQIRTFPEEIAGALAPEMGAAIKEQINLERDAMVDALYPVIGNTIAKYMAEAIRDINEQVENTFSAEGINRKLRAKIQGVSEAELILKQAMPFKVQAIFLINKASGLIISEIQQSDTQRLESEMVAGMLTAIRSFVNDCIAQSGSIAELSEIDYGDSKILLEVAGYCYLAVVIQGQQPRWFIRKMRQVQGNIVQKYGKAIELFDGDPATIPVEVNSLLEGLRDSPAKAKASKPPALLIIGGVLLGLILIPWGIYQYFHNVNRRIESDTALALASAPELSVYRLRVDASRGTVKISGRVPNYYLRSKAEKIARIAAPDWQLENHIIAVDVPADPVLAAAEVKRVTSVLNQMDGVNISSEYVAGKVTIEGTAIAATDANKITQAFEQIPGVKSVINTIGLQPQPITIRIYFDTGSARINPVDINSKIIQVKKFLNQYPSAEIGIIGHSDNSGNYNQNQQLAISRAETVRNALVNQGIDPRRMQVLSASNNIDSDLPLWLSRYVEFKVISKSVDNK